MSVSEVTSSATFATLRRDHTLITEACGRLRMRAYDGVGAEAASRTDTPFRGHMRMGPDGCRLSSSPPSDTDPGRRGGVSVE